ncbi:MAG: hypothetical protein ABIQ95_13110, partial [Bdellovibrionia bacterium]
MAILNRKLQWSAFFIFLCLVIYFRLTPIKKSQLPNIKVTELTLSRFFGSCTDQYSDVTDLSRAEGECGIIQVLTNKFNAENKIGAFVKTQTTEWSAYYNH